MGLYCECGRRLRDMYESVGGALMVECPIHGLHEWGDVRELPRRRFGRCP